MALTKDDLKAIKEIVETAEQRLIKHVATEVGSAEQRLIKHVATEVGSAEQRIMSHISTEVDKLTLKTGKGFNEAQYRIDALQSDVTEVKNTVDRIEQVQQAEISRVDSQEVVIKKFKKAFRTAV